MRTFSYQIRFLLIGAIGLLMSVSVNADDWTSRTFKIEGGGVLFMEYPLSWGKKPSYETFDTVTDIKFGPYGPKSKPIFLAQIQTVLAAEAPTPADLVEIAKIEVENVRNIAFETDIPINDFNGPTSNGVYFSITDQESKRGEFDYLTMAVVAADKLLIKIYFLSNDGAPDFGADAMQMMRSLKYTTAEELKKKK